MKKIKIKDKYFKVISEANIVQGSMMEKCIGKDLRKGIKPLNRLIIAWLIDNFYYQENFVNATAYCDDEDEFDEKTGIEVCSAKLELKNHMKTAKLYDRIHRVLIETANIVAKLCMFHVDKAKAIEDDLVREYGRSSNE